MSKKIKVLEALECGGPGGTGNQVAAICNGLNPERFEVGLVFAARGTDPETYRQSAPGALRAFYVPEMVREISLFKDLEALFKLRRIFIEERPDVVHAHSSKAGFLARIAAKMARVPKIYYSPRGYGFLQRDRSWGSRALYRFLEFLVSWIGEIIAISPSEASLAESISWGKPVHIVTDACLLNLDEVIKPPEHSQTAVGSCGRITAARNPEAFVNLCQRLTDSRNNIHCVWIGAGEQEPILKRHLENMNLLSKVEITGWLSAAEVQKRAAGLDIFVHYSRWDALPNAVLEAMALGIPVVASDIPGCRDLVTPGQTGFLAKTEIELLEHCLKLIDNPQLRHRLGQAGREQVLKDFNPKKILRQLEDLYSKF